MHDINLTKPARATLASLRIFMGLLFLWAFLDKTFGLGFETKAADAWIRGGHPTLGFLKFGTAGPLKDFYGSIAGQGWTDWLFMLGLVGVGFAMTVGIGVKVAGWSGATMTFLMWSAYLPPVHNPVLDEHLLEAIALILLALTPSGTIVGLGAWWRRQPFVQRNRWLE